MSSSALHRVRSERFAMATSICACLPYRRGDSRLSLVQTVRMRRRRACASGQEDCVLQGGLSRLEYGATGPERFKQGGGVPLLQSGMHLIKSLFLAGTVAVWGTAASLAAEQPSDVPAWL